MITQDREKFFALAPAAEVAKLVVEHASKDPVFLMELRNIMHQYYCGYVAASIGRDALGLARRLDMALTELSQTRKL